MGPLWSVILLGGHFLVCSYRRDYSRLLGGPDSLHLESSKQISKCHVEESRWWDLELLRLY